MSKSHRYDPDNPYDVYDRKDRDNRRRRTRLTYHKDRSRQEEFAAGISSGNNSPEEQDVYDSYGDYDYSRSPSLSRYTRAA